MTLIGRLIDCSVEEFINEVKDLSYGELCNLKKHFENEYQRVETIKIGLVKKLETEGDNKEVKSILEQIYIALQLIEDRCTIIETLKSEKAIKN